MITVVLSVYNQIQFTNQILKFINLNVVKPERIILIDDCGTDNIQELVEKYKYLNIDFIRHTENKGLNYSWSEGIELSETPLTSVLNNDLVLNKYFFKKIIDSYYMNWALICPNTIKEIENVEKLSKDEAVLLDEMGKREGWCWTGRTDFLKSICPIPSILKMYYGDDYVFFRARHKNLPVLKMMNNYIFHYGGRTINKTESCWGLKEKEINAWLEYKGNFLKDEK